MKGVGAPTESSNGGLVLFAVRVGNAPDARPVRFWARPGETVTWGRLP